MNNDMNMNHGMNNDGTYDNYNDDSGIYNQSGVSQTLETGIISLIGFVIITSCISTICSIFVPEQNIDDNNLIRKTQKTQKTQKTSEYKDKDKDKEEDDFCSICLEEYQGNDKISTLDCTHFYHTDCITMWINKDNSCPLCRAEV